MASPNHEYLFKLLVIGDSGVGKSALLLRLCDKIFNASYITTIGVDFKVKSLNIKDDTVKLQIWDTAGQEKFRTITSTYYRGAHGIMIVYDVTSRESFDNVKTWLKEIANNASNNVVKYIIGSKKDLRDNAGSVNTSHVSTEEGRKFAEELGISFIETSSKSGENVEQAFEDLAARIIATQGTTAQGGGRVINSPAIVSLSDPTTKKDGKGCC